MLKDEKMAEKYLYLSINLHKNKLKADFDLDKEENKEVLECLNVTYDGTIVSVKESAVSEYLRDKEIYRIRIGYEKMPTKVKITTKEDFLKLIAMLVPITESM